MSDDSKYSEAVGAIVTFFREAQEALNIARDAVEETESLTQDKLHMLELCDELKYHEIAAIGREIKELRRERRRAKDHIAVLEPIMDYVAKNGGALKALERLVGDVRAAEGKQENRVYICRGDGKIIENGRKWGAQ